MVSLEITENVIYCISHFRVLEMETLSMEDLASMEIPYRPGVKNHRGLRTRH